MAHIRVSGNVAGPRYIMTRQEQVAADNAAYLAAPASAPPRITVGRYSDKFTTTNLSYPLNVEGDSQLGHYIMFFINKIDKGALETMAPNSRKRAANYREQARRGLIDDATLEMRLHDLGLTKGGREDGDISNSILLKNTPVKRLTGAISLYMPPNIQVSYQSKYGDQEIGLFAETGYEAIKDWQAGKDWKEIVMNVTGAVALGVKKGALASIDVVAPGAKALFAIERGKIISPRMEVMFEGIGRRNFSYMFTFIPKSEKEAKTVHNIVWQFKYHMAANYAGGGVSGLREMEIPNMFDIEYMYVGQKNRNLNKIGTCVLTKMDVEYGGDKYVSHEGGVPQTTKLTLNFTELEIITKDHIDRGY